MKPWDHAKAHDGRREKALALFIEGLAGKEIAVRLVVHPRTIWRWIEKCRKSGVITTRKMVRTGRPRRLSPGEMNRLRDLLLQNPRGLGFGPGPWNVDKVQNALFMRFDIIYGYRSIRELMRRLGWDISGNTFFKARKG